MKSKYEKISEISVEDAKYIGYLTGCLGESLRVAIKELEGGSSDIDKDALIDILKSNLKMYDDFRFRLLGF